MPWEDIELKNVGRELSALHCFACAGLSSWASCQQSWQGNHTCRPVACAQGWLIGVATVNSDSGFGFCQPSSSPSPQ